MKKIVLSFTLLVVLFSATTDASQIGFYQLDKTHSSVLVQSGTQGFFPLSGRFTVFNGEFKYDTKTKTLSSGEWTVDVGSLRTGSHRNDVIFRSTQFLKIAKFPKIKYKTKKIKPLGGGKYQLIGDLTIRGKSIEVPFVAELVGEGTDRCEFKRVAFVATGSISRKKFGLSGESFYGDRFAGMKDKVDITAEVSATLVDSNQRAFSCGNMPSSRRQM